MTTDNWKHASDLLGELVAALMSLSTSREADLVAVTEAIDKLRATPGRAASDNAERLGRRLDDRKREVKLVKSALANVENLYGALGALQQGTASVSTTMGAELNVLKETLAERGRFIDELQGVIDALTGGDGSAAVPLGTGGKKSDALDVDIVEPPMDLPGPPPMPALPTAVVEDGAQRTAKFPAPPASTTAPPTQPPMPNPLAPPAATPLDPGTIVRATPLLAELKSGAPTEIRLAGILSHWSDIDLAKLAEIAKLPLPDVQETARRFLLRGLISVAQKT